MSRSQCHLSSAMTCSRISRRQLPTRVPRFPFCQGRLDARPLRIQPRRFQKRNHGGIEFRIAVQDQRNGMGQLPEGPRAVVGRPSSLPMILEKDQTTVYSGRLGVEFHADSGRQSAQRQRIRASTTRHRAWGRPSPDSPPPIVDQPPDLIGDLRSAASPADRNASTAGSRHGAN